MGLLGTGPRATPLRVAPGKARGHVVHSRDETQHPAGPAAYHERRRHGLQLACVVFPGCSGGPGGVIDPPRRWIGTTVGLMNAGRK